MLRVAVGSKGKAATLKLDEILRTIVLRGKPQTQTNVPFGRNP